MERTLRCWMQYELIRPYHFYPRKKSGSSLSLHIRRGRAAGRPVMARPLALALAASAALLLFLVAFVAFLNSRPSRHRSLPSALDDGPLAREGFLGERVRFYTVYP